eukprot:CAMPEP_0195539636 /NCGR_PEP_ID=MMETSP0794_2-20130614/50159_1 /TAXON_ID=515487 /ORGANISM="Stephanopyxis turris, Strain CCMP 815" /LENGTH=676 /DNA_ID=CAMNT_0040673677 /DNA_START=144 /DNA_END=2174 /DNA_ORIENTATION=-
MSSEAVFTGSGIMVDNDDDDNYVHKNLVSEDKDDFLRGISATCVVSSDFLFDPEKASIMKSKCSKLDRGTSMSQTASPSISDDDSVYDRILTPDVGSKANFSYEGEKIDNIKIVFIKEIEKGTTSVPSLNLCTATTIENPGVSVFSFADDIVTTSPLTACVSAVDEFYKISDDEISIISATSDLTDDHMHNFSTPSSVSGVPTELMINPLDIDALSASQSSASSKSSCHSSSSSSLSSSSSSSDDSESTSSSQTMSTLLSSDSSSRSSLILSASDSLDSGKLTNFTAQSIKIKKRAEVRKKMLRRISAGDRTYRIYLARQEETAQRKARNQLYQRRRIAELGKGVALAAMKAASSEGCSLSGDNSIDDEIPGTNVSSNPQTASVLASITAINPGDENDIAPGNSYQSKETFLATLHRHFLFEKYHSLPGMCALTMYCVAHISCYEAAASIHSYLFRQQKNQDFVYFATFIVGLILIRLSGSIWNWLSEERYVGVKFDMHNKLRLRDIDARFLRWIKNRPMLRSWIDVIGIYMCFISVGFFLQDRFMPAVCDIRQDLYTQLPSYAYENVMTSTKSIIGRTDSHEIEYTTGAPAEIWRCTLEKICCLPNMDDEEFMEVLEQLDEDYLFKTLSRNSFYSLLGWEHAPVVSTQCQIGFYAANAAATMLILHKIGVGFWDD